MNDTERAAMEAAVHILPISGLPEVNPGDDLDSMLIDAIQSSAGDLKRGDVVIVTHKIVSKAEGRIVDLESVDPSPFARKWAEAWGKDPRHVEVVLSEATRIVRMHRGLIIAETRHGFICANAGVDASNASSGTVVLLPKDPDASAERIRGALTRRYFPDAGDDERPIGVIVTDSFGRAWRHGIVNIAVGVAGINPLVDYRGQHDPVGYELRATVLAIADELAGAAELGLPKIHRRPAAIVRGYDCQAAHVTGTGRDVVIPHGRNAR